MALPTNECIPLYEDGDRVTGVVTVGAVTGKRFVKLGATKPGGGNLQIAPITAGAIKPLGVASADCNVADTVTVLTGNQIVPVTAGGTVTTGQQVEIDSSGRVVTLASGIAVGLACSDATIGLDCFVKLY